MKKQIILGMATLLGMGVAATGSVSAAESQKPVPVNYDNRNSVVDPDNPDLAKWGVIVPTVITFADDGTTSNDLSLELIALNGATLTGLSDTLSVNVGVASQNGMKLKEPGNEELPYTLKYGTTNVTGSTKVTVADLMNGKTTPGSNKKAGVATLDTSVKPTKLATYSDKLTYTISKTAD